MDSYSACRSNVAQSTRDWCGLGAGFDSRARRWCFCDRRPHQSSRGPRRYLLRLVQAEGADVARYDQRLPPDDHRQRRNQSLKPIAVDFSAERGEGTLYPLDPSVAAEWLIGWTRRCCCIYGQAKERATLLLRGGEVFLDGARHDFDPLLNVFAILHRIERGFDGVSGEGSQRGIDQELIDRREVHVDGAPRHVSGGGDIVQGWSLPLRQEFGGGGNDRLAGPPFLRDPPHLSGFGCHSDRSGANREAL